VSALTKITSIAKRIKKRFPNKHRKWTGYVKDAAKVYNKGGAGPKPRKSAKKKPVRKTKRRVAKVGAVKRTRRRVGKRTAVKRTVRKRTVYKVRHVVRRVGSTGGKMGTGMKLVLGIGAVLLVASMMGPKVGSKRQALLGLYVGEPGYNDYAGVVNAMTEQEVSDVYEVLIVYQSNIPDTPEGLAVRARFEAISRKYNIFT